MRILGAAVLLFATTLGASEPAADSRLVFIWTWAGRCGTPRCVEEERRFLAEVDVFYQIRTGDTTTSVELRKDGRLYVDKVPMNLSSKQIAALYAALDGVRRDLEGGSTWTQRVRVLPDGGLFTLAFSLDTQLHVVDGSKDYTRKEYVPLLNLLQVYAEPAAASRIIPREDETRIIGYRIRHDMPDHLALEVEYFYDGSKGSHVFVGANPVNETGVVMTGYRPNQLQKGRHTTCTVVSTYSESPERFSSDIMKIELYVGGGEVFLEDFVPLRKKWSKVPSPDLRCCDACSRGCRE
ncbi:MAG: hypothetical protein DMF56_27405 [Acidobacteria bacterium]|nr:MAG: hypothetical protein DMF56_27405 [Acidobacteriota bacterium]